MINVAYFEDEEHKWQGMSFVELKTKRDEYLAAAKCYEEDFSRYLPDGKIPWQEDRGFVYTWYLKAAAATALLMAEKYCCLEDEEG